MTYAADRKAGTYSRGMKQRLGIADVLMKDPRVIIMDEPTLGIDPEGIRALMSLIRELSVRDGRTILISSHQLYQVQQICDRVGIFVRGRLIACGPIGQLGRQLQSEGRYLLELRTDRPGTLAEALNGLEGVRDGGTGRRGGASSGGVRPGYPQGTDHAGRGAGLCSAGAAPAGRRSGGDLPQLF